MPLDDREQKILAEIERQFYEEDPELARAVSKVERISTVKVRLAILGAVLGLVAILYFLAKNTALALAGFALLVVSATVLVPVIRDRLVPGDTVDDESDQVL